MNQQHKLPIGIQTFSEIRLGDYYYVDKTSHAIDLINNGKHYFLSRPRRFGKSLFLDTLKELFEGNEALFEGLDAQNQWDWSVKYPVLRFSFGRKNYNQQKSLSESLNQQLTRFEQAFNVKRQFDDAGSRFADLIDNIKTKTNLSVVILIDEYDKPILDAISSPELAKENRDFLRGFYSTIKDYDSHIKFTLLTGVSKFSKVSLFSGLNNLTDITLDPRYSTICGYTDHDIDTVFAPELTGLDREQVREWYNGYNWLGGSVYNPLDVLQLFDRREFKNYWFETGTPTFLIDLISTQRVPTPNLSNRNSDDALLSSFDLENMPIEAVMFQTGYLTIKDSTDLGGNRFYRLGYPNKEVYQSLNNSLLQYLVLST